MNLKKYIIITCAISFLFLMPSCGGVVKSQAISNMTVEKHAIPPDFGKDESILLCVLQGRKSFDKYLRKQVSREYHGRYEYVSLSALNSGKYSDKTTYRYAFDVKLDYSTTSSYNASSKSFETHTVTSYKFFVLDRLNNTKYESPVTSSFFSKLMEAYFTNLEKERRKYHDVIDNEIKNKN